MVVKELSRTGVKINVAGIVQGVGFRPFVFQLADRLGVTGWIRNTSGGVEIAAEGPEDHVRLFIESLEAEAPPLAMIDQIEYRFENASGFTEFLIKPSMRTTLDFQPVSPDVCICDDCLAEMFNPRDRRYRYPFINCTNCGPRFTIIDDLPYDRPNTTMAPFEMCSACSDEYRNPVDRRYHAQPIACTACGPHIWFERSGSILDHRESALQIARSELIAGAIIAIRGLGGFHLACDATNPGAIAALRTRKRRAEKPLAVMMARREIVERYCHLDGDERILLESRQRPIVLLERKRHSHSETLESLAESLAPGQTRLGVMLPYTALHYLFLEPTPGFPPALVMTSGNRSEEPIARTNEQARESLGEIADGFVMHDRDIRSRCDDSVGRIFAGSAYPIRRARGFAPLPMRLDREIAPTLATGGELKNTFCLSRGTYAFLSHHIGDLENFETLRDYEDAIAHCEQLLRIQPVHIVYDLHPDYLSSRYALARAEAEGLVATAIQHHHAHIASCMGEHHVEAGEAVIGAALDGTGYGDDGTIWGGEFLVADYGTYDRQFHLPAVPMPGGEAAVREPWRMAVAWLLKSGIDDIGDLPPTSFAGPKSTGIVQKALEAQLNCPLASSMGRLFDAVSSLVGVRHRVTYEAQAAIELEALVDPAIRAAYPFELMDRQPDLVPMFTGLVEDFRAGVSVSVLSAKFHNTMANLVLRVCQKIRNQAGIRRVALSGGVWLNMALLTQSVRLLQKDGFEVLVHQKVPTNDGGLALGQTLIALNIQKQGG